MWTCVLRQSEGCWQNYVGWIPETLAFVELAYKGKKNKNLMMTVVGEGKETL